MVECRDDDADFRGAALASTFDDFGTADRVLGLGRDSLDAVDEGYLTGEERDGWLDGMRQGPFYASVTIVLTRLAATAD